jgi:hypothetical protein
MSAVEIALISFEFAVAALTEGNVEFIYVTETGGTDDKLFVFGVPNDFCKLNAEAGDVIIKRASLEPILDETPFIT